ncbi:MAG: Uma2 family endonuclease [Thioploca sp.]|nr:Uma2 family endonuclease [Thioploca sp.]
MNTLSIPKHNFTAEEFQNMTAVFSEDTRVELIEGDILDMAPIGNRHLMYIDNLNDLLVPKVRSVATVRVQGSIRLHDRSEPQPDLVILRGRPKDYANRWAIPSDVLLLIEVADSSFQYDKQVKVPLYARHGIIETWLFDLQRAVVEVYHDPQPSGYATLQTLASPAQLSPLVLPEVVLSLEELFIV